MSDAMEALDMICTSMRCGCEWGTHCDRAASTIRAALEQPSTAEAQARALEEAAALLEHIPNDAESLKAVLLGEAKRIREEG